MNRFQRRKANSLARKKLPEGTRLGKGWFDLTPKAIRQYGEMRDGQDLIRFFANDEVSASVYSESATCNCPGEDKFNGVLRVGFRRHDELPIEFSWEDFQWMKNFLIGRDRNAVEIFPAAKAEVNVANMRWLWVLPKGKTFGFGWKESVCGKHYDHRKDQE